MARRWVVVHLADGGTSRPLLVDPLNHEHPHQAMPEASALNAPPPGIQKEDVGSAGNHQESHEGRKHNDNKALNSTHLTSSDTLTLSEGSSLTLECHMPLVPELILEDMLWLFHPRGTPEGQCSLTPHKYLHSCAGFPSISETDDRNETFLRQTLAFSDMKTNHTGDYICQFQQDVKVHIKLGSHH
ncbi:hypothetical protein E2C01_001143 [Portunus trituberculatus]|uniref:Uncharacterized protein n=1 Tax=Portunus trituberculatus TaxID=210409 RepID=A0A5B7CLS6_PORTR|nr:hypothetical protein [Portunus trituberculatus]